MKNIKQDYDDLRPEYTRADFAGSVRGKFAYDELDFASFARAAVVCVGEDEELSFIPHSRPGARVDRRRGDWTYEINDSNQITLRYWLTARASIDEPMSNAPSVSNPQLRDELHSLLTTHIRALKAKVAANT
jgi:hypothetical protein